MTLPAMYRKIHLDRMYMNRFYLYSINTNDFRLLIRAKYDDIKFSFNKLRRKIL